MKPITRTKMIAAPGRNFGLRIAMPPPAAAAAETTTASAGLTLRPLTWHTGATAESIEMQAGGLGPVSAGTLVYLAAVEENWPEGTTFEWTTEWSGSGDGLVGAMRHNALAVMPMINLEVFLWADAGVLTASVIVTPPGADPVPLGPITLTVTVAG